MFLKTNLHFHTNDDPLDIFINYDIYKGIDEAKKKGFQVLALTCHNKFAFQEKYRRYAQEKGLLLIAGIEIEIDGSHVLILNCNKEAEKIKTFSDLRRYRQNNPQILIMAPHPYFGFFSLGKKLEKHIDLFDLVEKSWFYTRFYNRNKKAERKAKQWGKPVAATSDTHNLKYLTKSYSLVEAESLEIDLVLDALRQGKVLSVSSPLSFAELFPYLFWFLGAQVRSFPFKLAQAFSFSNLEKFFLVKKIAVRLSSFLFLAYSLIK